MKHESRNRSLFGTIFFVLSFCFGIIIGIQTFLSGMYALATESHIAADEFAVASVVAALLLIIAAFAGDRFGIGKYGLGLLRHITKAEDADYKPNWTGQVIDRDVVNGIEYLKVVYHDDFQEWVSYKEGYGWDSHHHPRAV